MPKTYIARKHFERTVKPVAVNQQLFASPAFTGVLEDASEVSLRSR